MTTTKRAVVLLFLAACAQAPSAEITQPALAPPVAAPPPPPPPVAPPPPPIVKGSLSIVTFEKDHISECISAAVATGLDGATSDAVERATLMLLDEGLATA